MRGPAWAVPAVTALGLTVGGLALAGCTADSIAGATPSSSATSGTPGASTSAGAPSATATPGGTQPVATCLVGDWRSTDVSGKAGIDTANASISGGSGMAVTIGPTGGVTGDFSGMRPIAFTAKAAGADASGEFRYAGKVSGTVTTTGGDSTSASGATSGTWRPVPPVNWGDTRVTVDLTTPVKARVLDNVRIGDHLGNGTDQTGDVVDINPLLADGRYQCQGNTIVLTPDNGQGLTWTLTRA